MSDFGDLTEESTDELATASSSELADQLEAASVQAAVSVVLTPVECRVLGALIEKEFLTPDIYPMTTNAVTTACNQKTNRDPVVSYTAVEVDTTFMDLRQRNLVRRVHSQGSRSTKHRQTLDEALSLSPAQLAIISVLLLRGAQTLGELRTRTERHNVLADIDEVEACLRGLAARSLVVQLERQPGHKENRWQHLLGDPDVAVADGRTAQTSSAQTGDSPQPMVQAASPPEQQTRHVSPAVENSLEPRVAALEAEVAKLRSQLGALADLLGESL